MTMRITPLALSVVLAMMVVAGCSGGFGGPKRAEPAEVAVDPNAFPANYRNQIATLLTTQLADRADFRGALIAEPAMKPIGRSQHYVVCLQLNGRNQRKDKVVVFLGGTPTQYIDSKPEQCADAVYRPFAELEVERPDVSTDTPYDFSFKQ
jgi:hypothetical protein